MENLRVNNKLFFETLRKELKVNTEGYSNDGKIQENRV